MKFQIIQQNPNGGSEKLVDTKDTQELAFKEADKRAKAIPKGLLGDPPIFYVRPIGSK